MRWPAPVWLDAARSQAGHLTALEKETWHFGPRSYPGSPGRMDVDMDGTFTLCMRIMVGSQAELDM